MVMQPHTSQPSMLIYSLAKIGKPEHLDDFRKTGRMRMPRLATFQDMEDDVGRGDRYDGLTAWLQPDKCVATFAGITLEGLMKPIEVSHAETARYHVYCLHAITSRRLPAIFEQDAPAIDPENFKLGTHALIITNVTEFKKSRHGRRSERQDQLTGRPGRVP
jgi:hypothetical protein